MTVKEIAAAAGVSKQTVYNRLKELGRLPTVEECKTKRLGRPPKYVKLIDEALKGVYDKEALNALYGKANIKA